MKTFVILVLVATLLLGCDEGLVVGKPTPTWVSPVQRELWLSPTARQPTATTSPLPFPLARNIDWEACIACYQPAFRQSKDFVCLPIPGCTPMSRP